MRPAKDGRAGKIIDRLEKDAREIDRIHPAKIKFVAQGLIIEHIFDASLRVVERALKRDCVNVAGLGRRHLAALHLRYAPMRIKDEEIDLGQTAKGLDGGGSGIARGCANDGRPLAPRLENMADELGEELIARSLNAKSRPVKQFEHKEIGIELRQRGDRFVPEIRVGGCNHASQGARLNLARHERRQDGLRDFLEDLPGKPAIAFWESCG